jgi:hypothetical protein
MFRFVSRNPYKIAVSLDRSIGIAIAMNYDIPVLQEKEAKMSDKDRQKKDHKRKDKENKAMRERNNPRQQQAPPRHQAKDESNLTDSEAADSARTGRPFNLGR